MKSRDLSDTGVRPRGTSWIDALSVGVLVVRHEAVISVNQRFLEIVGRVEDEVLGKAYTTLLAPEDLARVVERHRRRLQGELVPAEYETVLVSSAGERRRVELSVVLRGEDAVVTVRDVTDQALHRERRITLARVGVAAQKLHAEGEIFLALRDGLRKIGLSGVLLRPDGDGLRVVFYDAIDDAFCGEVERRFGRPIEGALGRWTPLCLRVWAEGQGYVDDALRDAGAFFADEVTRGLVFAIEPSRLPRAVAARIEHGALPRAILILRGDWLREDDVAVVQLLGAQLSASLEMARLYAEARQRLDELAATQARLVQRERLAAIGELAAVMAHEVRNPLGVIFNALSGLARVVPAGGDARLFVDIVREESVRLNRIVGDLLDYARPLKPELAPARLLDVIDAALDAAAAADQGHDPAAALRVVRDVPESLPDVTIDARLMRQAILNLALNAMQAMPTGGTLTVSARAAGKTLTIAVSDTGAGMSPEVAARVFEPFFTTRSTGTGLGLSVVKRIVESHEGEVSVTSRAGGGTTFTLALPAHAVSAS
jgi:PAS domain S-box-containing protein